MSKHRSSNGDLSLTSPTARGKLRSHSSSTGNGASSTTAVLSHIVPIETPTHRAINSGNSGATVGIGMRQTSLGARTISIHESNGMNSSQSQSALNQGAYQRVSSNVDFRRNSGTLSAVATPAANATSSAPFDQSGNQLSHLSKVFRRPATTCQLVLLTLLMSSVLSTIVVLSTGCGGSDGSQHLSRRWSQLMQSDRSSAPVTSSSHDLVPFRFPRYTSNGHPSLYVTAWPNHGAGVGHQFGEWLHGAAMSFTHNLTYVHAPFMVMSAKWTNFLGFGFGEWEHADVEAHYDTVEERVLQDNTEQPDAWIDKQVAQYDEHLAKQINAVPADGVYEPTSARVLRLHRIHVPTYGPHSGTDSYACLPELNLLLRQKYCMARIREPISTDLYALDRAAQRFVIALHMRCGDSCYNIWRATNLDSVRVTITHVIALLTSAPLSIAESSISFHLFSQSPSNNTAAEHFAPVVHHIRSTTSAHVTSHFDVLGITTLHHMIISDLLIGASSSFSWIAALLHHTASMGPISACQWNCQYDRLTGMFDQPCLVKAIQQSQPHRNKYDSIQDCHDLKPIGYQAT